MPRLDYVHCRICGKHRDEVGEMSRRRKCSSCANERLTENIEGMHTMSGHVRDRWARGMILSAGGVLPERLQQGS